MTDFWTDLKVLAPLISAGAACIALAFNAAAVRTNNRKLELDAFDRIHSKISELERRLYDAAASGNKDVLKTWTGELLNGLEYACFLFNNHYISDQRLREYWSDSIVRWYEKFFLESATQQQLSDPNLYKELKLLYAKVKNCTCCRTDETETPTTAAP